MIVASGVGDAIQKLLVSKEGGATGTPRVLPTWQQACIPLSRRFCSKATSFARITAGSQCTSDSGRRSS
jgi:hypothetical protein